MKSLDNIVFGSVQEKAAVSPRRRYGTGGGGGFFFLELWG